MPLQESTTYIVLERYKDFSGHMLPVMPFLLFNEPSDAILKIRELKKKGPDQVYRIKQVEVN